MQPLTYGPNPMDMVGYGTRPRGFAALQMALARLAARTGMGGGFMGAPMLPYNPMMMWDPALAQQGMGMGMGMGIGTNPYYQAGLQAGIDPTQAYLAMLSQGVNPQALWSGVSDSSGTSGSATDSSSSSTSGSSSSSSGSFPF